MKYKYENTRTVVPKQGSADARGTAKDFTGTARGCLRLEFVEPHT